MRRGWMHRPKMPILQAFHAFWWWNIWETFERENRVRLNVCAMALYCTADKSLACYFVLNKQRVTKLGHPSHLLYYFHSFLYIQNHMIFISLRGIYSLLFFLVVVVKTTEKTMKERLTRLILFFIWRPVASNHLECLICNKLCFIGLSIELWVAV